MWGASQYGHCPKRSVTLQSIKSEKTGEQKECNLLFEALDG